MRKFVHLSHEIASATEFYWVFFSQIDFNNQIELKLVALFSTPVSFYFWQSTIFKKSRGKVEIRNNFRCMSAYLLRFHLIFIDFNIKKFL